MACDVRIYIDDVSKSDAATSFSRTHNLQVVADKSGDGLFLNFTQDGVEVLLRDKNDTLSLTIDFTQGAQAHRRHFGGGKGQLLSKATGLHKGFKPTILDGTAGLGRDAFVMATLGARVIMRERSAVVYLLLENALQHAKGYAIEHGDDGLLAIISRMQAIHSDSQINMLPKSDTVDIVYLDPMFPERKKSALVKKDMRIFHQLVGEDADSDALLSKALSVATYRVVVKRPKIAPFLNKIEPTFQLKGKSSRFDIYVNKAIP